MEFIVSRRKFSAAENGRELSEKYGVGGAECHQDFEVVQKFIYLC